jgi:protein lin-54
LRLLLERPDVRRGTPAPTQTCLCQSCKNGSDNMARSEAISEVIDKDPLAFSRRNPTDMPETACNCRKSACLKKYCECFRSGRQCGEGCQCHGCSNRENQPGSSPHKPLKLIKLQ